MRPSPVEAVAEPKLGRRLPCGGPYASRHVGVRLTAFGVDPSGVTEVEAIYGTVNCSVHTIARLIASGLAQQVAC